MLLSLIKNMTKSIKHKNRKQQVLLLLLLLLLLLNSDVSELLSEHSGRVQNTVLIGAVLSATKVVQRQIGRMLKLLIFKH